MLASTNIGIDAIKIGMIGSAGIAAAIGDQLDRSIPIVFDPVMVAGSGAALADDATVASFDALMAKSMLVTPNAPELARLTGRAIVDAEALADAGRTLADRIGTAVLAKGGHLAGDELVDILIAADGERRWRAPRIETCHAHGTGCTLSSAIATGLGAGMSLGDAIDRARAFVRAALAAAPGLGRGQGPMGQGLVGSPYR